MLYIKEYLNRTNIPCEVVVMLRDRSCAVFYIVHVLDDGTYKDIPPFLLMYPFELQATQEEFQKKIPFEKAPIREIISLSRMASFGYSNRVMIPMYGTAARQIFGDYTIWRLHPKEKATVVKDPNELDLGGVFCGILVADWLKKLGLLKDGAVVKPYAAGSENKEKSDADLLARYKATGLTPEEIEQALAQNERIDRLEAELAKYRKIDIDAMRRKMIAQMGHEQGVFIETLSKDGPTAVANKANEIALNNAIIAVFMDCVLSYEQLCELVEHCVPQHYLMEIKSSIAKNFPRACCYGEDTIRKAIYILANAKK